MTVLILGRSGGQVKLLPASLVGDHSEVVASAVASDEWCTRIVPDAVPLASPC